MMRELPSNPEAEASVIGACFLDPACVPIVVDGLRGGDFVDPACQATYLSIRRLHREGATIDEVAVVTDLRDGDQLQRAGGAARISAFTGDTPTAVNISHHVKMVKEESRKRDLFHLGIRLQESAVNGVDVGELLEDSANELDLIRNGHDSAPKSFPVIHYTERPAPPTWVVQKVIEAGTCVVLSAEPKCGKTWFTLALAIAIATGQEFLGQRPKVRGKILFYSPEGSQHSMAARIHGLCWGMDVDPREVAPWLPFIDARLDLSAKDHAARLAATIDENSAIGVVIDPMIAASVGVDENSASEVSGVLDPLRDIITARPGCFLIVAHHTNKASGRSAMSIGLRGSSAIHAWLDTLITIRRREDDSDGPRRIDIAHRDAAAPGPMGYLLAHSSASEFGAPGLEWFRLDQCEPPELGGGGGGQRGRRKDPAVRKKILDFVNEHGGKFSRKAGADALDMHHNTFNPYFTEMQVAGEVHLRGHKMVAGPEPEPAPELSPGPSPEPGATQ